MLDPLELILLAGTGLFSAFLGSVAGTGGSAVLLPVLVLYFGIHQAVPIITIANLSANLSRAWLNRGEIDRSVVGWFVLGTLPAVLLGTYLFTITPPGPLTRLLGAFLIAAVIWRRWRSRLRPRPPGRHNPRWFFPLGAGFGFLAGLVIGIGPLMAPFFLAYGLMRGAFIGTDALATVFMQFAKLGVFGSPDFLHPRVLAHGLGLIPLMIGGAWLGKRAMDRMPERFFAALIEATLLVAGTNFLLRG